MLYICWKAEGVEHYAGPFWTVCPDGSGEVIGQDWRAYQVQTENHSFKRIIIPVKYHFICSKNK